jgi:hypothetical protein
MLCQAQHVEAALDVTSAVDANQLSLANTLNKVSIKECWYVTE